MTVTTYTFGKIEVEVAEVRPGRWRRESSAEGCATCARCGGEHTTDTCDEYTTQP